ncbi:AP-4 complex subunit mu-1 [Perkinsus chesapeaki]|uniref:AP-4 complex subunit mu-1 n=1 Tax=Perkinsus chesapeaki TaxID=330153 RepID=A0A7J6M7J3_PERCH|nr:AP-4 complex subunit mu-1 [Perkinsus chesapeaki]
MTETPEKVTIHAEAPAEIPTSTAIDPLSTLSVEDVLGHEPEESSSPKWSDVKREKMMPSGGIKQSTSTPGLPVAEQSFTGAPSLNTSESSASCTTEDIGVGDVSVYGPSSDASICTLGGGKPLKNKSSWGEALSAVTIGPRAAGTMLKVPLRRFIRHPKRKSWNSNMESYISALRSVGKHLSGMSVKRVRKLAEKPLPNMMLPKGVFRFSQTLRIDGHQEPLQLTWMWPNEITPKRPPELAVQKIGPSISVLKENPVILYVPGTPFCVWGNGVHRHMLYLLAKRAKAIVCCISNNCLPPACSLEEGVSDVKAMYKHLINDIGVEPGYVSIAGDSLGAGMATLALVSLRDEGVPLPSSVCLLSPITDLADQVDTDSDDISSSTTPEEEGKIVDDSSAEKSAEEEEAGKSDKADEEKETGGLGESAVTKPVEDQTETKPQETEEPKESKSESSKANGDDKSKSDSEGAAEKPAETATPAPAPAPVHEPVEEEKRECVDYVQRDLISSIAQYSIGNCCPNSPEVSPYYADLSGLPNMLIQAGQDELFLPQIERFAAKVSAMKSPDTHFQFQEYEEMVHCFPLFSFCTDETEAPRRALGTMGAFVQESIKPIGINTDSSNPLA